MDIHKPKPWHGLREFLKEYLIIVIGVLTALAAEAVVENLHERRLASEARETVRAEINLDLANMKRRGEIQPCIDKRLNELSAYIGKAEAGQPITPPLTIGEPGHPATYTQRWQAATAGGRASLLPSDEQRDYIRVYQVFEDFQARQAEDRLTWGELMGLEGVQRPSPELLADARMALGRAKVLNGSLRQEVRTASLYAGRIGIQGVDPELNRLGARMLRLICLPLSTPPAEAEKMPFAG
ncbi:hypothetical protein [Phenylobacterium sp.]|jgi:hypothetical protein|uniref:hypothetical protein n=1 Tax=Phenylobacterium sp. TaxID=1871053 RepID=UPI002F3E2065